jgi:cupin domain
MGNNTNERTTTNKLLGGMTKHLTLLRVLSGLFLWLIPGVLGAREPQIEVRQILQTTQSWDGVNYQRYPTGQPQLTVLRITIPPKTALHWHHHPVISVGYVLSGHLTIEKRDTGERTIVHAGQARKMACRGSYGSEEMGQRGKRARRHEAPPQSIDQ